MVSENLGTFRYSWMPCFYIPNFTTLVQYLKTCFQVQILFKAFESLQDQGMSIIFFLENLLILMSKFEAEATIGYLRNSCCIQSYDFKLNEIYQEKTDPKGIETLMCLQNLIDEIC